jgi:hypothetical protein
MANYKIRQEINIINREISGVSVDQPEIIKIDPGDYTVTVGTAYNKFEAVVKNSDGSTQYLYLEDSGGAEATVPILANTASWTRVRTGWTLNAGATEYWVQPSHAGVSVQSARVILLQDAADIIDTQTQIEIGAFATEIPAATNTDYELSEPKYWKYESAKWDPTPTFTIGFTMGIEDDMETYVIAIQEASDAAFTSNVTTLTDANVTVTTEAVTYYESGAFTPTNNYYYRLVYQGDDAKDDLYFYNAKIIATQSLSGYSEGNYDSSIEQFGGSFEGVGQSFDSGAGGDLNACRFYLFKEGSPTGNSHVRLYAHTGTFGTSSEPTGSALATSDNFDVTTLTGTPQLIEFTFSTPYEMSASTKYVLVHVYTESGGLTQNVHIGRDASSPTHSGNAVICHDISSPSWTPLDGQDLIFRAGDDITKLQTEYLMMNEAETGTGNQEDYTYYDPAEWNEEGGSLTYYHEHTATNAADNSKLEYDN